MHAKFRKFESLLVSVFEYPSESIEDESEFKGFIEHDNCLKATTDCVFELDQKVNATSAIAL